MLRVLDIEHPEQQIFNGLDKVCLALIWQAFPGRLGVERKANRLANGEGGVVHILFRSIHRLAFVYLQKFLRLDARIMNIAIDSQVLSSLPGNRFQKGAAAGARTTQNQYHLSRFREASETFEKRLWFRHERVETCREEF